MHFCLSNVCIVRKRNNLLQKFLYHIKGTLFLCVNTVSDRVVRHSLSCLSLQKIVCGTSPDMWKFVAPKPPRGVLKNAKWPFLVKKCIFLEEICYKVPLCKNCPRQSYNSYYWPIYPCKNGWCGCTFGRN